LLEQKGKPRHMVLLTGNSHFTDGYHLHQATIRVV
jgi:hypothetical protein